MAQETERDEPNVHMVPTSAGTLHGSDEGREDVDFLDFRAMFASPARIAAEAAVGSTIFNNELEQSPAHPQSRADSGKLFSPLRVIYSPSKFFRSPVVGKDSESSYALTTPVMLKKSKQQQGRTTTQIPPLSAEKAGPLTSPFSGWKVEHGEKYRFMLSPMPVVATTPVASNDDDNRSFLTFAQSLPAITDLNNLDSSPSVTVSPLTPEPPLAKLCYGKDRTPDTDTECPARVVTQRLEFTDSPTSAYFEPLASFPNIQASTSDAPGRDHRTSDVVGRKSVTLQFAHPSVMGGQATSLKSINDSMRKGKAKVNKNAKAFKALRLVEDTPPTSLTAAPPSSKRQLDESKAILHSLLSTSSSTSFIAPSISDEGVRKKARVQLPPPLPPPPPPMPTTTPALSQNDSSNSSSRSGNHSTSSRNTTTNVVIPRSGGGMPGQAAVTPKKRNPCNCKKSQCLKLYCECFASGSVCDENCKCVGCHNIPKFDIQRKEAIAITLERNPNAFKPKINTTTMPSNHDRQPRHSHHTQHHHQHHGHDTSGSSSTPFGTTLVQTHHHGCHCKKSFCRKKYCECFQAGVPCGDNCKCIDCKNQGHANPPGQELFAATANIIMTSSTIRPPSQPQYTHAHVTEISDTKPPSFGDFRSTILRQDKLKGAAEAHVKRKLVVYPLFGPSNPPLQKDVAVHILQHLDGPDLYNASIVNRLWNGMTMSTDIWDYSQLDKVP
ncbi:hypothetical protein, variant [Aphanomyces astaci]|uniref:CRC domain-containing protein n=1 Tax=Aphanomyces astaci TaxID=112090 RepID=W4GTI5_APHAT|nr:hypothetical protein, variant [Aphanomyces astaci]ETV82611.1 hypothetical protein, variant [Aphanomyces astaci]|eukprot:XP_009828280.1 hypothetical protein, variant [Aphanomyces astaci]